MSLARDINQSFWRGSDLPWIELRSTWQSHHAYKLHHHAQLSIGAILEGETLCVIREKTYRLQAGDIILIDPQAPHSCNPIGSTHRSYHMLYLDVDWCLTNLTEKQCSLQLTCSQPFLRDPHIYQHYLNIVNLIQDNKVSEISALVRAFLHKIPSLAIVKTHQIRLSSQVLQQRLLSSLEYPPTLNALAQETSLCKETLIRTFKQDIGLTPGSFLHISRIEYAKSLLREGKNIIDASNHCGFADQSHFHKTFVRYTAATPGQYALSKSISDNN